ncbi:hypothetical protein [Pedobacter sp. CFBP9032]|uniref:hypothetical protein n=1 Tax=Pedobacter sp. CFBP9032 TaxID=3096539 RepID=UPI002A6A35E8|nr:hypothetical protein [Pedobacter sp. CFBP9032]MDY0906106.1 hypothetical protein [Pedobacter sp. CFBP9032]
MSSQKSSGWLLFAKKKKRALRRPAEASQCSGKQKNLLVLAGRAFFLLTAKETKLPARNFLSKSVAGLGQCRTKKMTMPI